MRSLPPPLQGSKMDHTKYPNRINQILRRDMHTRKGKKRRDNPSGLSGCTSSPTIGIDHRLWALFQQSLPCSPWMQTSTRPDVFVHQAGSNIQTDLITRNLSGCPPDCLVQARGTGSSQKTRCLPNNQERRTGIHCSKRQCE